MNLCGYTLSKNLNFAFLTVWQKLVEENQDFFEAYHLRLMVKHQINVFNELLKQQVDLMHRICPARVDTVPIPNGSQLSACKIFFFFCSVEGFFYVLDMSWAQITPVRNLTFTCAFP